ncbi:MAG: thiol-activated cytolysin family protein [Lachnospiraceae bacterium]
MGIKINVSENAEQINQKIKELNYRPEEVLAFSGDKIGNLPPKKGEMKDGSFIVVTKIKHELSGDYNISVPNAYSSLTYPGALLIGNQKLIEGRPDPISISRSPLDIVIDLPGLTQENNRVHIDSPDFGNVLGGINSLLNNWFETKGKDFAIPANMQYKKSILYDEKAMALAFGCDVSYMQNKLGIDFNMIREQKKSAYLMQFRQIYYTVSTDLPQNPADVFSDKVTWEALSPLIDANNPPVYVQNVQFGREIYVLMESDMSSEELETHLNSSIQFSKGSLSADFKESTKALNNSIKCTIMTYGGKPIMVNGSLDSGDIIKEINDLITENTVLSESNPAAPLCYTTVFLKNNVVAHIQGRTEYVTSKSESFSSGSITLRHDGAYVAMFTVSWDEYHFDENGNEVVERKQWNSNGVYVTAGYSTIINFPANARNISIKAEGATGLAWEPWRTSLDLVNVPLIKSRNIAIYGTTLDQLASVDPPV